MEIRRYLAIVRRRFLLVIAIIAAALVAGWLITPRANSYTATSTLYVGSRSIDINPTSGQLSADRVVGLDRLITTFGQMASTRPIVAAAIATARVPRSPDQVAADTSAAQVPSTDLIHVSYTDQDPAVAQALTNAIASSLVDQIRNFEPRASQAQADQVLSMYDQARLPTVANPSGLVRNLVLAGLFGVIVAGAVLALLEYLDITMRTAADVERQLELPVLGVVPALGSRMPIPPVVNVEMHMPPTDDPTHQTGAPVG